MSGPPGNARRPLQVPPCFCGVSRFVRIAEFSSQLIGSGSNAIPRQAMLLKERGADPGFEQSNELMVGPDRCWIGYCFGCAETGEESGCGGQRPGDRLHGGATIEAFTSGLFRDADSFADVGPGVASVSDQAYEVVDKLVAAGTEHFSSRERKVESSEWSFRLLLDVLDEPVN